MTDPNCLNCRFWLQDPTLPNATESIGLCSRVETMIDFAGGRALQRNVTRFVKQQVVLRWRDSGERKIQAERLQGVAMKAYLRTPDSHYCSMWKARRSQKKAATVWERLSEDEGSAPQRPKRALPRPV